MTKDFIISIVLDKRRLKKNGKYPIKLRVFQPSTKKQKLYTTNFEFTEQVYQNELFKKTAHKDDRLTIQLLESKANEAAEKITPFNFDKFERLFIGSSSLSSLNVNFYYKTACDKFRKFDQISNANNYALALKSFVSFNKKEQLNFSEITVDWLNSYEKYMVDNKGRSKTTVSIYLRTLRTIFNNAIEDNTISREVYPFLKRKYTIPSPKGVKKALTDKELKTLFEGKAETPEQQKAKDFWFFSYSCNGINFADILNLKWENLEEDSITFYRKKTASTNKEEKPITIFLNPFTMQVINTYSVRSNNPKDLIFPIIDKNTDAETKQKQRKNFTRFVNQHFKKYAKHMGIDKPISTYWARHSFATKAIRSGASIEFISEALAHTNIKTTANYFAGFEQEKKKEIANSILKF